MPGACGNKLADLAKQEAHHVEHVYGRLVEKTAGRRRVTDPRGIDKLAAIHLDVCRVWRALFQKNATQHRVDRGKATVMPDLKDRLACLCRLTHAPRVPHVRRHRLFTKDVLARMSRHDGQLRVPGVRRRDVNGIDAAY
jgi:hypothetical protein